MKTRKKIDMLTLSEVRIRGFSRVQLGEVQPDGPPRIVGDSGWLHNTITNDGRNNYLAARVGSLTQGKNPQNLQLATQSTAVDATQETLVGETRVRKILTASTIATGTLRMTASWSSTDNTAAITIGSIAVYNVSSGGTMGSGQTFTTSQWASAKARSFVMLLVYFQLLGFRGTIRVTE